MKRKKIPTRFHIVVVWISLQRNSNSNNGVSWKKSRDRLEIRISRYSPIHNSGCMVVWCSQQCWMSKSDPVVRPFPHPIFFVIFPATFSPSPYCHPLPNPYPHSPPRNYQLQSEQGQQQPQPEQLQSVHPSKHLKHIINSIIPTIPEKKLLQHWFMRKRQSPDSPT